MFFPTMRSVGETGLVVVILNLFRMSYGLFLKKKLKNLRLFI